MKWLQLFFTHSQKNRTITWIARANGQSRGFMQRNTIIDGMYPSRGSTEQNDSNGRSESIGAARCDAQWSLEYGIFFQKQSTTRKPKVFFYPQQAVG